MARRVLRSHEGFKEEELMHKKLYNACPKKYKPGTKQ